MTKLIDLIKLAKSGDEPAMIEIIEKFKNLINKYVRLMNYDEDCRSELILKLISLVKNEIDIDKLRNCNDGVLVKYISQAIRNHYITISKVNSQIRNFETGYDQEAFVDLLGDRPQSSRDIEDKLLLNTMQSILTEREFICVYSIVIDGWTAEKVAKKLGITKQAVNQCKLRALNKLKNELF